ncbi:MAG: hypothetical protein KOO66_13630 [Bacteroidales bacterium]|nr:hypothetical protein [Bacteroidales bacterium]
MKGVVAIILSMFYMTLSTGAMVNIHYCGGELESIKVNSIPVSCCCGDTEMTNSCCQDEELILKLDVDQQIVSLTNNVPENLFVFTYLFFRLDLVQEIEIKEVDTRNYYNPPPKLEPIWLINCTLTYYG